VEALLVEAEGGAIDVCEASVNIVAAEIGRLRVCRGYEKRKENCYSGYGKITEGYNSHFWGPGVHGRGTEFGVNRTQVRSSFTEGKHYSEAGRLSPFYSGEARTTCSTWQTAGQWENDYGFFDQFG
jgi:hypothetical protein